MGFKAAQSFTKIKFLFELFGFLASFISGQYLERIGNKMNSKKNHYKKVIKYKYKYNLLISGLKKFIVTYIKNWL